MFNELLDELKDEMEMSEMAFREDISKYRTGKANPALVKDIKVVYYGAPTPLFQLATISTPDPKQIMITPFDKTALGDIEKAIQKSELGINPNSDGSLIRLIFPPLTEERRKELVKAMKKRLEDAKVSLRNHRRTVNDKLKKMKKDGEASEDDIKKLQDKVQDITDEFIKKLDLIAADKEKDILNT